MNSFICELYVEKKYSNKAIDIAGEFTNNWFKFIGSPYIPFDENERSKIIAKCMGNYSLSKYIYKWREAVLAKSKK